MQKKKIIHFFPRGVLKPNMVVDDSPNFYLAGWPSLQAKGTLQYSDEFDVAVWRTDENVDTFKSGNVAGIECQIYPIKRKKIVRLSLALIRDLRKDIKANCVLLNLHKVHTLETTLLCMLFGRCPIVLHHHGSIPYEFRRKNGWIKNLIWKSLSRLDRIVLKRIDYFSVISVVEKKYLESFIDKDRIALEQGRRNFKNWLPMDKRQAKMKFGMGAGKKIIIYIGYYYRLKGVDHLLHAYKRLKGKYDVELFMIGGLPSDELYGQVKESGAKDFGVVPNVQLASYLNAADVYCAPALDGTWVNFGGITTAIIEAMACNVPVVSRQLIHFPTDEWKKIGEIPETLDDVALSIERILDNPGNYSPRETAQKYYDFEVIMRSNIAVYHKLFERYYGEN